MDPAEIKSRVKQMIVEELDLNDKRPEDIDDAAPLFGDRGDGSEGLGLDSLDALQLAMAVEERFGVQIPEGDGGKKAFASVNALAAYVAEHKK